MSRDLTIKKDVVLSGKVFSKGESLITELLEVKHFALIKHVFLALMFGVLCRDVIRTLTNENDVDFGWSIIESSFAKFHLAAITWICLFVINLLTYSLFKWWALIRIRLSPKSFKNRLWDTLLLGFIILYYFFALYVFPLFTYNHLHLGIASIIVIHLENIRFIMKTHAFVRTTAPDVLNYKEHSDENLKLPPFSSYIYFSFAPTSVYRREYPRTAKVNLNRALWLFLQVLLIIWMKSYIYKMFFFEPFRDIGKSKIEWKHVIVLIFENFIGGGLIIITTACLLLHTWLNAWAELMRFADKRFYEDWWTSTNYSAYFRTWNIVVNDWLYEYVYRDVYHHIFPYRRGVAKSVVFLLSTLIHEHILFFTLKHFLPILSTLFICLGVTFTVIRTKHPVFNIFFWYSLALGNTIQLSLHVIEYFARANCPYSNGEIAPYLVPRFITMNCSK